MADVGTFSFDDLSWNDDQLEVPALPRYVPQVDTKELGQLNADLNWPAFAVGLRRVFSPVSWKILPGYSGVTANEALGLDVDVTTVLVGYGEDPLVEAFWTRRHAMFDALAAQQWGLVLAPNYSMYGNQPRTEHLLNFRRNIQIATEMRSNGINAVPNLYWFREEDLERTCSWLMDEEVPAAAINLQTFRTEADWQLAVSGLAYFSVFMPDDFRLVVTGSSRQDRISVIASLFEDRMTLIGSNALIYGRHGAVMGEEGREDVHARTEDAFAHNVRFYDNLIAESSGLSLAEIMDQLGR